MMKYRYKWLGAILLSSFLAAGCSKDDTDAFLDSATDTGTSVENVKDGYFDVTFFANEASGDVPGTRAAITGTSDRIQTLMYILYKKNEGDTYQYVKHVILFRPDNYHIAEEHYWPHEAVKETLPNGDYRVVFLGNLDSNLFPGQGSTHILSDYRGTAYGEARIHMPQSGPNAFTNTNMFYMASTDFNQSNPNVQILLQRIVSRHEYQREFVDANTALSQLVDNIAKDIKEKQLTTDVVSGLLHSALLEPIQNIPLIDVLTIPLGGVTKVVDAIVGGLTGDLIEALNKVLLQQLLTRLESTLKTQGGDADLLGLSNLLNPWSIANYADISGKFVTSVNFDLQAQATDANTVAWENIPMIVKTGEEVSKERYLAMTLLNGDNLVEKIDIKKEGLLGPIVDGVVDDAALYGRLINVENDLNYSAAPNIKYHTNYALLNLTLDDYSESDKEEQLHLTAKLNSALVTEALLEELLGPLGSITGALLSPLLQTVTGVLDATTFALDIKLPDLGIHNIVIEGGWEKTTNSLETAQ